MNVAYWHLLRTKPLDCGANAYQKTQFGIVHVRTDGSRVRVATHSAKDDQKESYAFQVNHIGEVSFEPKTRIV